MKIDCFSIPDFKNEFRRAGLLCLIVMLAATGLALAQSRTGLGEESSEKWQSGEVGYIAGCSLAASLGEVVCLELPSGKQAQKQKAAADASAAVGRAEVFAVEAGDVSTSISQATDPEDSSGLDSDALTAREDLKSAADEVVASTPDAFTLAQPYTTEPSQEKVPAYTFGQRVVAWGIEHIPAQETQNTPPQVTSLDQVPSPDPVAQANYEDIMRQYYAAAQRYQQAQQNFTNMIANRAARAPITTRYAPVPAPGPQIHATTPKVPYNGPWVGVH